MLLLLLRLACCIYQLPEDQAGAPLLCCRRCSCLRTSAAVVPLYTASWSTSCWKTCENLYTASLFRLHAATAWPLSRVDVYQWQRHSADNTVAAAQCKVRQVYACSSVLLFARDAPGAANAVGQMIRAPAQNSMQLHLTRQLPVQQCVGRTANAYEHADACLLGLLLDNCCCWRRCCINGTHQVAFSRWLWSSTMHVSIVSGTGFMRTNTWRTPFLTAASSWNSFLPVQTGQK